ncbi:DNA modification methylase [Candidatus Gracilibacteria bacterium]|nr:DNA modification methylase [Candidatus Gracilibacteria bacterium]
MKKVGYIAPIIVDEKNMIICGHGRLLSLKRFQENEVDVIKVHGMPEKEKKYYRIKDNTSNLLSGYNKENLMSELMELGDFGNDIPDDLPFDMNFDIFDEDEFDADIEDHVPEVNPEDLIIQKGDIFQLGNHYLMCGDSSDQKDVGELMNGEKAQMIFTDPPYNVNYKGQGKNTKRGIENDHMGDQAFDDMLVLWFQRYAEITRNTAGVYVFHSSSTQAQFEKALLKTGFDIKNQIIWNKPSAALGWGDYRWKHEPLFYCSLNQGRTNFYGDRTHGTVIDTFKNKSDSQILNIIKRARAAEEQGKGTIWSMKRANVGDYVHPTQKPVELIEYALFNSSKQHDIVADFFGGSGSTLIACEKTNRSCRMMELDPLFVQVIIKRYYDVTKSKKEIGCVNREIDFNFLEK